MVGRAGRPQFDTHGVAVIMTSRDSTYKYQRLLAGQVMSAFRSKAPTTRRPCIRAYAHVLSHSPAHPVRWLLQVVESCLLSTLPEHLNAEIVLGTVKDVSQAIAWIRSTFLFTRVRANPQHYG